MLGVEDEAEAVSRQPGLPDLALWYRPGHEAVVESAEQSRASASNLRGSWCLFR
jgi:hypothetical protein